MRVLVLEPERYDAAARAVLEAVGTVDYVDCDGQEALCAAAGEARYEALVVRLGLAIDRAVLDAAPGLRWIVTPTTGLDHLDLDGAAARGITVVSLRGEHDFLATITPTAELAWTLLLAVRRRLVAAHGDVLAGGWRRDPFVGEELDGATLGIIGFGRLGRMVARYGRAFGMDVVVHDRSEPPGVQHSEMRALDIDDLLSIADVVSLHLPLDVSTVGFLSSDRMAAMKPSAVLVNTARGELVDEDALLDALRHRRLAGAGLDVLAGDSRWNGCVPEDHPLVSYARAHDNLVLTPHIGGYARQALERTRLFIARKFAAAAAASGATPSGVVSSRS